MALEKSLSPLTTAWPANTSDRGNRSSSSIYLDERHCPLWLFPDVAELRKHAHSKLATFAQCMLGAQHQNYTTLMYTAGLDAAFSHLDELRCIHKEHAEQVGGVTASGEW